MQDSFNFEGYGVKVNATGNPALFITQALGACLLLVVAAAVGGTVIDDNTVKQLPSEKK